MSIWLGYVSLVKQNCTNAAEDRTAILFWRNELFAKLIIYLFPLCLIALLPGLYWIFKIEMYALAAVDIIAVGSIAAIAFLPGIVLSHRKITFMAISYLFSIAILYFVSASGVGLVYLLTSSIFSLLIFSSTDSYWPAWLNTSICALFALLIGTNMMPTGDVRMLGEWIATSTNLIFLSFLSTALIPKLFGNLQLTINDNVRFQLELKNEQKTLDQTSVALIEALSEINKIMDSSPDVICVVDANDRFLKVSWACESQWGYASEELVGKPFTTLASPGDLARTTVLLEEVTTSADSVVFENRCVHKNGKLVPISWSIRCDERDGLRYGVARNISVSKQLEKALEVEKQRFYDLFLEAPSCMGILSGPNHIYEVVNPLYLELIGKTDIIGKSLQEVLPEVVNQGFLTLLNEVYLTGKSYAANEVLFNFDALGNGKLVEKYLNFIFQAHTNDQGTTDSILFFAVEVTEQVLSRRKIEVSETRLKEAQSVAKLGNWEIDMINDIGYWSDEVYKLFGVSKTEISPSESSFISFIHPEDIDELKTKISQGYTDLQDISFDFRFIKKDGTVRCGYNEWRFKFDSNGNPEMLFGIIQDVTERKEAEQQLKDSEAFNRGVLDSLISNIAVIDQAGEIVAVNEPWKAFGRNNGAISSLIGKGTNYYQVCKESTMEVGLEASQGIKAVMEGEKTLFYMEYPCHSPDQQRWFGMRAMKFGGNKPMVVVSHHDISERKFAELERNLATKDLIQRNSELEQFTYIVSHNLRAPVANILGLASIWDHADWGTGDDEMLKRNLRESVSLLDNVVKDLNKILQIKGGTDGSRQAVRLSKLFEDLKINVQYLIQGADIDISCDFTEIDTVLTVESYLYSIFYNLVVNSISYRKPEGPCLICIKSHAYQHKLVLVFSDNGMGIDLQKYGDQVFSLYKRFHPDIDGKGMGLFMVKTQVEKLGGKIDIHSKVNKGTAFTIEFEL